MFTLYSDGSILWPYGTTLKAPNISADQVGKSLKQPQNEKSQVDNVICLTFFLYADWSVCGDRCKSKQGLGNFFQVKPL